MKAIDLRSDTVTQPTPAMREAMAQAQVGDDVFREDPTVNRLEEFGAEMVGKEAALFVASGTMGNLVSLLAHCQRGDEAIVGDRSHTFLYEVAGAAGLGGIQLRSLRNREDGTLDLGEVEEAIRPPNIHFPPTGLICLENTHNRCGGAVLSPAYMESVGALARRKEIPVHLDGARIFNAAISLRVDVKVLTKDADSVMFCLSKGLSAPVGSLVTGRREFIERARKMRKMVGGGMRQAGHLAAAGIVALTEMVDRLAEDHYYARLLAEGLAEMRGIEIDLDGVKTNIIIFSLVKERMTPAELVAALEDRGVRLLAIGGDRLRAVTHYGIEEEDIKAAVQAFREVLQ